jgi:hypothetical protein
MHRVSAEPVEPTQSHLSYTTGDVDDSADLALTVAAPHIRSLRRTVVVDWRNREHGISTSPSTWE